MGHLLERGVNRGGGGLMELLWYWQLTWHSPHIHKIVQWMCLLSHLLWDHDNPGSNVTQTAW